MQRSQVQQIKRSISVFDYARNVLKVPIEVPNSRCQSFREGAKNATSLLITNTWWFDFGFPGASGQGLGGDVIDLCAHARHGGRLGPALRELAAMAGLADDPAYKPASDAVDLTDTARAFHAALTPADRGYLHGRGISDDIIDQLLIGRASDCAPVFGLADRIAIPFWQGGRVRYFVGRALGDEQPKYKCMPHGPGDGWIEHPIWGLDSLAREGRVVICEGLLDAVSVWQVGLPVLASGGVRFSKAQQQALPDILYGRDATVAFDFDPESGAGQAGSEALARVLFHAGVPVRLLSLDGGARKLDLNDLHAQGRDLREIISSADDYWRHAIAALAALSDSAGRKDGLRQLLQGAVEAWPWAEVAEMLAVAKSHKEAWEKAWLQSLERALKSPPSDNEIVERLGRGHQLVYDPRTGWFRYSEERGVWVHSQDVEVEHLISRILGRHVSGPRLASAARSARCAFHRSDSMNPRPDLLNLPNGLLRVSDRQLLPHDPSVYSTIQVKYPWDAAAKCPRWEQFLHEITEGRADRQAVLQEMFGYCLLADAKYESGFILLGKGSNGKSVVIHTLTEMLGEENVSCVPLSQLAESFQRIRLYAKLANVSTETSSRVAGVEEVLKQIISGDMISGAQKYRDEIEFRPFCTCIFAANGLPETQDTSFGLQRRMIFVRFPLTFLANPTKPTHRKKDPILRAKLREELPGILNWALDGLDRLRRHGEFTSTQDQAEAMAEFLEIANPVHAWLTDEPPQISVWAERKQVYRDYKTWCNETNTKPLSARKFWPRVREITTLEERKSGDRLVRFHEIPGHDAQTDALAQADDPDALPF